MDSGPSSVLNFQILSEAKDLFVSIIFFFFLKTLFGVLNLLQKFHPTNSIDNKSHIDVT